MSKVKLSRCYVYLHKHPETQQIVYVGKGTAGRAWSCNTSLKDLRARQNLSYVKTASKLGTNTMTIWRALNNKTKAYAAKVGGSHV